MTKAPSPSPVSRSPSLSPFEIASSAETGNVLNYDYFGADFYPKSKINFAEILKQKIDNDF